MLCHFFSKKALPSVVTVAFVMPGILGFATPVTAQVRTAVEYGFYSYWDDCYYLNGYPPLVCDYSSYFVTSSPDEIEKLDARAYDTFGDQFIWERTGEKFDVWSGPEGGALATCRFFDATFDPDHFYTPYTAECAGLQANPKWQYEGIAFYLKIPDENGNCPIGTTILYRLYNSGIDGAPAHRFTTSTAAFNQMLAKHWVVEGDSRTFASACVPSSTAPQSP